MRSFSEEELEEIREGLAQFNKDHNWLSEYHAELLEKYPDQWVAVFKEKIVGAGPDLNQIIEDLRGQGIDTGRVAISLIETNPRPLILQLVA